jgi:hypothetical protein
MAVGHYMYRNAMVTGPAESGRTNPTSPRLKRSTEKDLENETAGDNPFHINVLSIIQQSWPGWPKMQIASALKRVEFVKVLDKIRHGRHPGKSPASTTVRVSRPRGKHPLRTIAQILCDNSRCKVRSNRLYKIPAADARLTGWAQTRYHQSMWG